MNLPLFYSAGISATDNILKLDEDTSRHCIQVLRMQVGEQLQVTNGIGALLTASLSLEHKKAAEARVLHADHYPASTFEKSIAISLIKNTSRFEWFLEKATELGIRQIIPLICERTEKQHFRLDRMKNILVSAMLQSHQVWLPRMVEPLSFQAFVSTASEKQKFIAHCLEEDRKSLAAALNKDQPAVALIGPEGDFTKKEIDHAIAYGYIPVTLGETRLRTETAGVTAAVLMQIR